MSVDVNTDVQRALIMGKLLAVGACYLDTILM